ncbi:sensor histidine kinase [Kribbella sp. CA-253562]|uniref:sensor histidine kinase n=1 Tax=Kribbella sp. CA-253562 TaxID=3239942 RepID=UPI003D8CC8A6
MWGRRRRTGREQLAALVVSAGLVVFVVLVYVVIVLGGGVLIGHTSSPHLGLSVVATAVVALGFEPVRSRLVEAVARLIHGGVRSPYDMLSRFSSTVDDGGSTEDLTTRMAEVLAVGTGARAAQVWLLVDERLQLAATWPPAAEVPDLPGRRELAVRQGGELLGLLVVQESVPLTPVEERLFAGLASQAGLVLRGARLRAELVHRVAELSALAQELRLSRERLVDVQDAERRRLERDIHDGAQQHLVALAVNLSLAHTLAGRSPDRADRLVALQSAAAATTIATIAELSRGIYPSLLVDEGLGAALATAISRSPLPVEFVGAGIGRYAASVEAAAYFCALEALQNSAKHSSAAAIRLELRGGADALEVVVSDDGVGFDPLATRTGAGLVNLRDRVESAGGTLTIETGPARGTVVAARLPGMRLPDRSGG